MLAIPAFSGQSAGMLLKAEKFPYTQNKNFILAMGESPRFQFRQIGHSSPLQPYFCDLVLVSYCKITRPLAACSFKAVLENNIT